MLFLKTACRLQTTKWRSKHVFFFSDAWCKYHYHKLSWKAYFCPNFLGSTLLSLSYPFFHIWMFLIVYFCFLAILDMIFLVLFTTLHLTDVKLVEFSELLILLLLIFYHYHYFDYYYYYYCYYLFNFFPLNHLYMCT